MCCVSIRTACFSVLMRRSRWTSAALVVGVSMVSGLSSVDAQRSVPRHAPVRSFTPAPNSVMAVAPKIAAFAVGEPGRGGGSDDFISVYDARGRVISGALIAQSAETQTVLSTDIATSSSGWFLAHWNVESEDGHMVAGNKGKWWTFGHRVRTKTASPQQVRFVADVPRLDVPTMSGTLSGARIGARSLQFGMARAELTALRVTLVSTPVASLRDATLEWAITPKKRPIRFVASGVFPVEGTYQLLAQVSTLGQQGSITGVWRATVVVKA